MNYHVVILSRIGAVERDERANVGECCDADAAVR
jgi:hypothetical protein